jgi:O-antigen/teichoic acid export membrane protein
LKTERSWLQKWSLRLLSVTCTQVFTQVLNGVVAFVLIRTLTKQDYAWFTIATGMAAVLNALNDGGVATAVTSIGGGVWQDRSRLSSLMSAALATLNRMVFLAAAVVVPLLTWLLWEKEASWLTISMVCVLVAGPQWIATRTITLSTANRLHSRIRELQVVEMTGAGTRSLLTLLPAALGFVNIYTALGAVAVSVWVQGWLVRKQVMPLLDLPGEAGQILDYQGRVRSVMRSMYPNVVFNCVQTQLATGLLAVFGSTAQVADLGALNRLSFFGNFIGAPIGHIIGPAFARCQDLQRLRRLFVGVLVGYLALLATFVGGIWWQAPRVLSLFGPKYAHLEHELFLVAAAIAITFINQVVTSLNFSRGWVRWVWLNIPLTLAAQVTAAILFRMDTVAGAAQLMIATAFANLFSSLMIAYSELIPKVARQPG